MRIFLLLLLLLPLPANAAENRVYTVGISCVDEQRCPMIILEAFIAEAYARAGTSARFVRQPRLRDLQAADHGLIDATAVATMEAIGEYPHLAVVPTSFLETRLCAYSWNPQIKIRSLGDLGRYAVAVVRGDIVAVRRAEKHADRVYLANTYEGLFRMLDGGRVDAVLVEREVGRLFAQQADMNGVRESPPLLTARMYHAVNAGLEPALVPALDRAIRGMLRDGTARRLLGKAAPMVPVGDAP